MKIYFGRENFYINEIWLLFYFEILIVSIKKINAKKKLHTLSADSNHIYTFIIFLHFDLSQKGWRHCAFF